ncbi:FtsW/RodA/SpoVE family cell cycle protein [Candidatus Formimonas warabiya]|uniref:Cell division protein n=1 Tax=Formimonas warabiya TaxID=1761012 RepID=A0A3G1KVR4_FORW1|nr:FtsW/RodA/SpoVE family cell cycle protein [Candidatus Formimonas warabiya]ATW26564.1 cell division protein [Candidatus Formimonas warabiya]
MVLIQNPKIQAYIGDICAQIKFREVHQEIQLEINTHLQESMEEYMAQGFSEDEAVNKAIVQMGSADTVGKELNKVHQPKPEWSILSLSLFFAGLGLAAMYFMGKQGLLLSTQPRIFTKTLVFIIMGAVIVPGLYLFDYRKLEPYSKYLYLGTLVLMTLTTLVGVPFQGKPYLNIGPFYLDIIGISPFLFSIAFAGLFHKWQWNEPKKLLQGFLICLVPLFLILTGRSLSTAVIYSIMCLTLMAVSGVKHRISLLLFGLLGSITLCSVISTPYRLQRLITFLNPSADPAGSGWLNIQLSQLMHSSGFFGQGFTLGQKLIPDLHTDFIFSYITFTFGWIAGGILVALVVLFMIRIIFIATTVKNSYGRLLTSGLAAIFAIQFFWNISMNLGWAPISEVGLPFISFGGSRLILNAAALGIISSIYRRKNISLT